MNVSNISNISGNNTAGTWVPQAGVRSSVLYTANPNYPRLFRMDGTSVVITAPGVSNGVAYPLTNLLSFAAGVIPALTYTPVIGSNPSNVIQANTASTSFQINATAEVAITYGWQRSVNAGFTWSNIAAAGVYSNVTTNTLNISNVSGLTGNIYRCVATDVAGSSNSAAASLTAVHDPSIIVDPSNQTVASPYGANVRVTAVGATSLSYQWQNSADNSNWANISASAVFSNVTTNSMTINTVAGLGGQYYRCFVSDSGGNATSNAALLTVT